jgi:hypothetical protein
MINPKLSPQQVVSDLAQFTGTNGYHRMYGNFYLTDGAKYLAETAECFWLFDLYWSHIMSIIPSEKEFTVLKLTVKDCKASAVIEDGNDNAIAGQEIEYTDFPLPSITLYCSWFGDGWVAMLPSEY